jgi:hypothetical protein
MGEEILKMSREAGLETNKKKTKCMSSKGPQSQKTIKLEETEIEE